MDVRLENICFNSNTISVWKGVWDWMADERPGKLICEVWCLPSSAHNTAGFDEMIHWKTGTPSDRLIFQSLKSKHLTSSALEWRGHRTRNSQIVQIYKRCNLQAVIIMDDCSFSGFIISKSHPFCWPRWCSVDANQHCNDDLDSTLNLKWPDSSCKTVTCQGSSWFGAS